MTTVAPFAGTQSLGSRQGITTSNGFVDVVIITVENEPSWLLPAKLIIGTEMHESQTHFIPWEGRSIPVLNLLVAPASTAIVLVLNADDPDRKLGLMVREQPIKQRIRISSLRDYDDPSSVYLPYIFQSVLLDGVIMQVPSMSKLEQRAFGLSAD